MNQTSRQSLFKIAELASFLVRVFIKTIKNYTVKIYQQLPNTVLVRFFVISVVNLKVNYQGNYPPLLLSV